MIYSLKSYVKDIRRHNLYYMLRSNIIAVFKVCVISVFFPMTLYSSGASIIFSSIHIYANCWPKAVMQPFTLAVRCLFKGQIGERRWKIREQCGSAVTLFFCWAQ